MRVKRKIFRFPQEYHKAEHHWSRRIKVNAFHGANSTYQYPANGAPPAGLETASLEDLIHCFTQLCNFVNYTLTLPAQNALKTLLKRTKTTHIENTFSRTLHFINSIPMKALSDTYIAVDYAHSKQFQRDSNSNVLYPWNRYKPLCPPLRL